ncbi:hypothetical protein [Wenjunlia tyrosinilytica]|uniref:Uncharacterized protein n=1 Tax=Wenjunlia tyrosinilytica TaxID=1544741 RepID=A0A917ZS14_9ACTN|nr:hypothetical protein [Wenjunlia tyrosinilytica]GGO88621.1 hypothetical protein GCM10012280_29880 [Wenjunlia tyrosinilytica]
MPMSSALRSRAPRGSGTRTAAPPRVQAATRARDLLMPLLAGPTEPVTLTTVKCLLWADVIRRSAGPAGGAEPDVLLPGSRQDFGFWEYLDRVGPEAEPAGLSSRRLAELHDAYLAQPWPIGYDLLRGYAEAADEGRPHPVAARMRELFEQSCRMLGVRGFEPPPPQGPGPAAVSEVMAALEDAGLVRHGGRAGQVVVGAPDKGVPSRTLLGADGRPHPVVHLLRDLLPVADRYGTVILLHAHRMSGDYVFAVKLLRHLGVRAERLALTKVLPAPDDRPGPPSDRVHLWRLPLDELAGEHGEQAVRLALRLYFVAALGKHNVEPYRDDLLRRTVTRAVRVLEGASSPQESDTFGFLVRWVGADGRVDPYRLTASLFGRRERIPDEILRRVFL